MGILRNYFFVKHKFVSFLYFRFTFVTYTGKQSGHKHALNEKLLNINYISEIKMMVVYGIID